MRTRWLVLSLGLSLAGNLFLAAVVWQSQRTAKAAQSGPLSMCSADERQVREMLVNQLCACPPDRAAIAATLARLDTVRSRERAAALERWLALRAASSPADPAAQTELKKMLCPWKHGEMGNCAPSSTPGSCPNRKRDQVPEESKT
jgi:hypothetical protein